MQDKPLSVTDRKVKPLTARHVWDYGPPMHTALCIRILSPAEALQERARLEQGLEALDPALRMRLEGAYESGNLRAAMFGALCSEDEAPLERRGLGVMSLEEQERAVASCEREGCL